MNLAQFICDELLESPTIAPPKPTTTPKAPPSPSKPRPGTRPWQPSRRPGVSPKPKAKGDGHDEGEEMSFSETYGR